MIIAYENADFDVISTMSMHCIAIAQYCNALKTQFLQFILYYILLYIYFYDLLNDYFYCLFIF